MSTKLLQRSVEVLDAATVKYIGDGEFHVFITSEQLTRPVYEQVRDVLERIAGGGKWKGGKTKAFVYPHNIDPSEEIKQAVASGEVPLSAKAKDGFVPTPDALAQRMVEEANISRLPKGAMVLEPSLGTGRLAYAIHQENGDVTVMGIEPNMQRLLQAKKLDVGESWLLAYNTTLEEHHQVWKDGGCKPYAAVIMNPPFTTLDATGKKHQDVYVDHILRCVDMLQPGGYLAALMPCNWEFKQGKRFDELRALVQSSSATYDIDSPFAETAIDCTLLVHYKPEPEAVATPTPTTCEECASPLPDHYIECSSYVEEEEQAPEPAKHQPIVEATTRCDCGNVAIAQSDKCKTCIEGGQAKPVTPVAPVTPAPAVKQQTPLAEVPAPVKQWAPNPTWGGNGGQFVLHRWTPCRTAEQKCKHASLCGIPTTKVPVPPRNAQLTKKYSYCKACQVAETTGQAIPTSIKERKAQKNQPDLTKVDPAEAWRLPTKLYSQWCKLQGQAIKPTVAREAVPEPEKISGSMPTKYNHSRGWMSPAELKRQAEQQAERERLATLPKCICGEHNVEECHYCEGHVDVNMGDVGAAVMCGECYDKAMTEGDDDEGAGDEDVDVGSELVEPAQAAA